MFQKTNFNGFDTGEYEDMMINTNVDLPPALPSAKSPNKRTSFVQDLHPKKSSNTNDFMSNISSNLPQWPEPEAQWPEGQMWIQGYQNLNHLLDTITQLLTLKVLFISKEIEEKEALKKVYPVVGPVYSMSLELVLEQFLSDLIL